MTISDIINSDMIEEKSMEITDKDYFPSMPEDFQALSLEELQKQGLISSNPTDGGDFGYRYLKHYSNPWTFVGFSTAKFSKEEIETAEWQWNFLREFLPD